MGVVKDLLQDVEIPKFYKVANKMDDTHIEDVAQAVRDALKREGTLDRIKPGSTVCFTAASREIANSVLILRTFAEELKRIGKDNPRLKFCYTIPNFQNPSGITMSLEKRHRLYELAKAHDVMILEDNPYGDLYYEGKPLPSIKSFDTDGIVIYAGSFSKVISPGMRVGYAIGPKPVLAKMTVCKQGQDVHTNIWSQVLCYRFMTEYDFDAHLAGLRKIYTKKRALLLDLMEKHLAPYITWDPFNGGLFAWCHLPKGVDMMEFVQKALEKKVCVVPGTAFLTDENEPCDAFRINFSTPTDEQLTKGITLLGETIREMVEK